MSEQINFYIVKNDWENVIQYIENQEFTLIANTTPTSKPIVLEDWHFGETPFIQKYLVLASQFQEIQTKFSPAQNWYYIDVINSPVIEVQTGFFTESAVYRGRFYYDKGYFENDNWVEKNKLFLQKAKAFFDWFKEDLKPNELMPNHYVSPSAQRLEIVV